MKELQAIVNDKVAAMVKDNTIQSVIEKCIESSITEAISSQFKSYGTITKSIEKAIEEGLEINIKSIPFETYNEQMLVAVKQRLGNMFKGMAAEKFMNEMESVLSPAPAEISIIELVEGVASFWKSDEPWNDDTVDEYATVEIENNFSSSLETFSLKMWKQKESGSSYSTRTNSADLQLYFINQKLRISHRQSYNPTCFNEHEAFIFKLYAAGTTVTGLSDFDPDDCELCLKEMDY